MALEKYCRNDEEKKRIEYFAKKKGFKDLYDKTDDLLKDLHGLKDVMVENLDKLL